MNRIVLLLIMGVAGLASRGATAQDLLDSPAMEDLPPQSTFAVPNMSGQMETLTLPDSMSSFGSGGSYYDLDADSDLRAFDCSPALLESTGTWFRRGFWFAEADAVLFNRRFGKGRFILMSDESVQVSPNSIQTIADLVTNRVIFNRNALAIVEDKPGAEGAPRLKVGRFLYRDHENRDHTLEFTVFGGGNWSQGGALEGGNLVSRILIDSNNTSFDSAQRSQYTYDSWLNSFELSYHIRQRMAKDRMELEPSGHWVRRAQPSRTNSFIAGVRYLDLSEDLDWDAFDITNSTTSDLESGNMRVQIGNHMLGTQMGLTTSYETDRWSFTALAKGGLYLNMIDRNMNFNVGTAASGLTDDQADNLAWIGEVAVIGRWHIHSNLSLRTGLEVMHLAGTALAPYQVDFVPGASPNFPMGHDVLFVGGSIGLESYW